RVLLQVEAIEDDPGARRGAVAPAQLHLAGRRIRAVDERRIEPVRGHRERVAGDRLAIEAAGHDAAIFLVGVAVFQARGERPQLAAIQGADERRDEIAVEAARSQRHRRIERLDRRCARLGDRLAVIDADVERPALVQLPTLRPSGIRKQPRTELRRALVDARLQLRTLPRHGAHADTRRLGIEEIAVGMLPLAEEGRARAPVIIDAEDRARGEVDAGVLAAEREVLRGAQRNQILEQIEAAVDEGMLGFGVAARQTRVRNVARAGAERVVIRVATQLGTDEIALRAGHEHFLAIRFALDRESLAELVAAIDADLAGAGFAARLLADAEARFLLAYVRACVEPFADMRNFGEIRSGARRACRVVRLAARQLGAQLGRRSDLPTQVCARDPAVAGCRAFLQVAGADLDAVVRKLDRRAPAGGHLRRTAVEHFVFGDDVDGIEVLVAARHRLLEEQRAVQIVEAVVDERRQRPRLDDDLAAEAIAHFKSDLVAVENDRTARQPIQARSAIALQLVLHVALLGLGRERAVAEVLASVV